MIREMRALGRPDPEFREQGEVVVTFRQAPTPTGQAEGAVTNPMATGAGAMSALDRAVRPLTLAQRQEMALRHVQEHGAITNKTYRSLTGVSDMTALRDLETLLTEGSLRAVGRGRGRRYTL